MAGMFDDLIPGADAAPDTGMFSDLVPDGRSRLEKGLDVAEDIGRGIVTAPVTVAQGITELGAAGLDLAFDTDYASGVTDSFENFKEGLGPEGRAGEITEDVVAFGLGFIPIAGWLGRAGQVAKGAKAAGTAAGRSRFIKSAEQFGASDLGKKLLKDRSRLAGTTALGTLGYGAMVSPDGRTTLSDNYDTILFGTVPTPGILETEQDTGLTGRQEALRRLRNKLRVGTDDALTSLAFDFGLMGVGKATRAAGETRVGNAVAKGFTEGLDAVGKKVEEKAPNMTRFFNRYFTSSKGADDFLYEPLEDAKARSTAQRKEGLVAAQEFDKAARKAIRASGFTGRKHSMSLLKTDLNRYLTGVTDALDKYPQGVQQAAKRMSDVRDQLTDGLALRLETEVRESLPGTPRQQKAQEALDIMRENEENGRKYLRRLFDQYERPELFYKNLNVDDPMYQDAIREVSEYMYRGQGTKALEPESLAMAKRTVDTTLGLNTMIGKSPKQAVKDKLEAIKKESRGRAFGLVAKERPELSLVDGMFEARKPLIEQAPTLRKLMGEIEDPIEIYTRTVEDVANTTAALDYYKTIKNSDLTVPLNQAIKSLDEGGRPAIVQVPDFKTMPEEEIERIRGPFAAMARDMNVGQPEQFRTTADDLMAEAEEQLRAKGYVSLGESDIGDVMVGKYGDLTGMYASPESYAALTAPLKLGMNPLSEAAGIMQQMRALYQKMAIVPNPGAQVRNITGNGMMLAGNGNLPRDADLLDTLRIFTANMDALEEAGLDRFAKVVSLSGVADTSLVTSALKEYANAGKDLTVSGRLSELIDAGTKKIPLMQAFENVYSNSDTYFKALGILGEQKKLMSAFDKSGLQIGDPRLLDAMAQQGLVKRAASEISPELAPLEVISADIVKATMPTYTRVAPAVRELDRIPLFGNFTSFASENLRNGFNTVERGLREMAFEVPESLRAEIGEEAATAFEKQIRGIGSQRVAGYVSVATVAPQAITRASMIANDMGDEQMAAFYQQNADYLAGHDFIILDYDGEGKVDYVDMSYVNPYSFVVDPAKAALRAYAERGKLGQNEVQQLLGAAFVDGLGAYAGPFGSESMVFERLRDVLPESGMASLGVGRGGKTDTGAEIYGPSEAMGDKLYQGTMHILGGMIPNYLQLGLEVRGGEIEYGRMTRALMEVPGTRGQEFDKYKELVRLVTGFTPMRMDLKKDFRYSGLEYSPLRTDAKQQATRMIRRPDATSADMVAEWGKYLDNLYRVQTKLYADIQAARALGLKDKDIYYNLMEKANLGRDEVAMIMQGKFFPTFASNELADEVAQQMALEDITRVTPNPPFGTFSQMSADRIGQSLDPGILQTEAPEAPSNMFDDLVPQQAPSGGMFDDLVPQQEGSLQVPTGPRTAAVSPALLGDNPVDIARNMEIASTQRQ